MGFRNLFLVCFILILGTARHIQHLHQGYNATVQKVIDAACFKSPPKRNIEEDKDQSLFQSTAQVDAEKQISPTPARSLSALFVSNPDAPNWVLGNMTRLQYQSQLDIEKGNHNIHKCPLDKPFSTGTRCISCPDNQIFNLKTKQCEECPPGSYYNQKQKACTLDPPLLYNTNTQVSPQNYVGKPPDNDPTLKNCPFNVPFTNFTGCLECRLPRYYNYDTLKCQKCPQDFSFNVEEKRCVSDIIAPIERPPTKKIIKYTTNYTTVPVAVPPIVVSEISKTTEITSSQNNGEPIRLLTSPAAPNILYGIQDPKQYKVQYSSLKTKFRTCPGDKPYFNGQQCISCPQEYPLFDMDNKLCISCPKGTYFDKTLHRCSKKAQVQPSLQRFLMNIK